jgi:hypothetical protein
MFHKHKHVEVPYILLSLCIKLYFISTTNRIIYQIYQKQSLYCNKLLYWHVYGLPWLIFVGSRFGDWIYWTSLLLLQLITTAHTLNSFWIAIFSLLSESRTGLSSLEFWFSGSRTELTSCGPNIDHQVGNLIVRCFSVSSVATKTCCNLQATLRFRPKYSLP